MSVKAFSAEEKLLLSCLSSLVKETQPVESPSNVDWEAAYKLAAKHNLVPFLEFALPNGIVPDKIAGLIKKESRRRKMRAAVMIQDFKTIHSHLVQNGVRAMPIKGVALAHTIYPNISLRYFDDLDLLVPKEQAQKAEETLQKNGYIIHPRAPKPDWHHLPPYIHQKHNTMIEIHTDLFRRVQPGWDIDSIWQRARRGTIEDQETWLMADTDALIYTALHARHNLYGRLSYFLDGILLALKIPSEEEANNNKLVTWAREAGGTAALAHILATGSRLFEVEIDLQLPRSHTQRWAANKIGGWQTLQPGRPALQKGPLPNLVEISLMDSLSDSLHLARRLIAPPPEFVSQGYGNGEHKTTSYGKRLVQRLSLAAGQFIKIVRDR